jgi:hypothetical protein
MPFEHPIMVEVEQKQLIKVHRLVEEMKNYIAQYDINHPVHQEYINTRLQMLHTLLTELRGLNREQYQAED